MPASRMVLIKVKCSYFGYNIIKIGSAQHLPYSCVRYRYGYSMHCALFDLSIEIIQMTLFPHFEEMNKGPRIFQFSDGL